jgi:hypothetical protein
MIAELVNITLMTRTYGRYIELVNAVINQLMSGHNHIVGKRRCALLNHQKLKNILISPSKNEINADDWCFTQGKMDCLPNNMETHGYASNKRAICC